MRALKNVWKLGVKELYSLARDPVLIALIVYTFTMAVYTVATGVQTELRNAAIAIVDEDRSALSGRIRQAFLRPYFKPAEEITYSTLDRTMDEGRYSFVLVVPSGFEADVLARRSPTLQLHVDATAMAIAGSGASAIQTIAQNEARGFLTRSDGGYTLPVTLTVRAKFNPNLESAWFMAVMQIINNVTLLAIILSGAAVIREREHGTIEHLLVMPVTPGELMLAKVWANGLVIVVAAVLSLVFVVERMMGIPIAGSVGLFAFGTAIYLFAVTSLGIMLSTVATTMPQFGLLSIPVFIVMNLLSGGMTPLESMPEYLQTIMQGAPSTHFTKFAVAVLYRGAGMEIVWPQLVATLGIGFVFFGFALARFRKTMAAAH